MRDHEGGEDCLQLWGDHMPWKEQVSALWKYTSAEAKDQGRGRGLGVEAKDLTYDAKAKDFKIVLEAKARGLQHW